MCLCVCVRRGVADISTQFVYGLCMYSVDCVNIIYKYVWALVLLCDVASTEKAQRLKEAKEEAAKEIEEYRKTREVQFQEKQQNYAGSKDDFAQKMQEETKKKIQQIELQVEAHKEVVIKRLLELVSDIKPELHQNIRLQQQKTK